MAVAGAAVEDEQSRRNDHINRCSCRVKSADLRSPAFDLSGGEGFDCAEPVEGVSNIDQSVLTVCREILSCDGEEGSSVVASSCRLNRRNRKGVLENVRISSCGYGISSGAC